MRGRSKFLLALTSLSLITSISAQAQLSTSNFEARLTAGSGVLRSLTSTLDLSFDFSPDDVFKYRDGPGQYHTGDLTFHYRSAGGTPWRFADTAALWQDVSSSSDGGSSHITTSLNPALPHVPETLNVTRTWQEVDGDLALSFTIRNHASEAFELGSLGMPIEFNNIFTNRTASETTEKCVFVEPYIGLNAGYAQVTRLTGTGPSLVVTPLTADSKFEGWQFLEEPEDVPLGYRIQTFEGNYAWQTHTLALAETEWKNAEPWNPPTSAILQPGRSVTVGLRFSVAGSVQEIESEVSDAGLPTVVGVLGYIVPPDLTAKLFVNSKQEISAISAYPAGSLQIVPCGQHDGRWKGYDVTVASSNAFGRVRLEITYGDDSVQAVHYWIAHSSPKALSEFGTFLTTEQWFTNRSDPFGRAPGVITYNRDTNDYVDQDNRTWIAGMSDEGGAGSFLAAGMKQYVWPDADEVAKLEQMVEEVVWGGLQLTSGNETYAVRKSLFFYEPELVPNYEYDPYFNWTVNPGQSWDKEAAYLIDRTYNYLLKAYNTVAFSVSNSSDGTPHTSYWHVGLMGVCVWGLLLSDLYAEGYTQQAEHMEDLMLARQRLWAGVPNPFGSEMAWDSTGEEGVYYWSRYFNDSATAQKTIEAIRGYMPTIPSWAYNGNVRRYWDFLYAGDIKLRGYERQIHHYGSGLNALQILDNYHRSKNPQSLEAINDLRVGYGGNQGPLSNIDEDGFGSMAFHGYPDRLIWDAYSRDYGPNFLGHVIGAATYLIDHPIFGWISFGGNVQAYSNNSQITVQPRDAVRKHIFIAEVSLWVEIDAGVIEQFALDTKSMEVVVNISSGSAQQVLLKWEQTAQQAGRPEMKLVSEGMKRRLDGWTVDTPATVRFFAT
ncbi:hypothetical protein LTR37_005254 [Vermiconidia calcicola]|uniref:Uncharacterized protein n=1 Tax=Vermiconidia calcicola TaxID=1690605 RepID=A0ACC3NL81_9PEZI|nr:hypothetical protein LTR37_005254 [Vermiconidia calcicola]